MIVVCKDVEKFIRNDKAELKENHKNILLRPVVYDVGKRYISDQKQLFPNNTKQAFLRDLKELRETIKTQANKGSVSGNKSNNLQISQSSNL